jgi:apolipoprotein N-acyltransferase
MIPYIASGAAGLLLSLSFPPWGMDLLAWVAFVPFLWAVHGEASPRRCAVFGAVFGLVFFAVDVRWVTETLTIHGHFSSVPAAFVFLLMIVVLSLYPAAFAYILGSLRKRGFSVAVLAPFVWTGLEYARATLFTGFPWDLVGYSQVNAHTLIQVADITGVYGISFLVMLVNAQVWEVVRCVGTGESRGLWRLAVATVGILAVVLAYGHVREGQFSRDAVDDRGLKVGVLQGNIEQGLKWERSMREHTFLTYAELGQEAVDDGAELLIWPETSAPVVFGSGDQDWQVPGLISQRLNVPMLIGAPSQRVIGKTVHYYNSAFLVDGTNLRSRFDKIHLVPFGEYMPLSWLLPLGPGIAAREADYSAGETMTVMSLPQGPRFSVLICYEAIFPELARLAVNSGGQMLLNITNDGWFGESAAPYQHLAMAGMRSVENRVWLIRSANTGISAAFDPTGRMEKRIPLEKKGFFTVNARTHTFERTFYCRFGDVFAWGCIGICALVGLSALRRGSSTRG